jgi:hypothetical protein
MLVVSARKGPKVGGKPRCHLPINAVRYPASARRDASVGWSGGKPITLSPRMALPIGSSAAPRMRYW